MKRPYSLYGASTPMAAAAKAAATAGSSPDGVKDNETPPLPPVAVGLGGTNTLPDADAATQYFNWSAAGFSFFEHTDTNNTRTGDVPGVAHAPASISSRLHVYLDQSTFGKLLDVVQVVCSLISCAFYVMSTYEELSQPYIITDVVFACIFAIDYILWFIAAENKCLHIIKPFPVVDILTIAPVFVDLAGEQLVKLNFLRFMRFLRVVRIFRVFKLLRVLRMWRLMRMSDNNVTRQIMTLVWTFLSIVFCAAGVIQIIEQEWAEDPDNLSDIASNFFAAVYFVVVSISTVGYGDIYVETNVGRFAVVLLLLFTFIVIPLEAQRLAELIRQRPRYQGRIMVSKVPHVVVVGFVDYDTVHSFLWEFFHTVHGPQQTRVIFLSPEPPSMRLAGLLMQRSYSSRTVYLQGTVFEDEDLIRAGCTAAQACFVLNDGFRRHVSGKKADQATVLRVAAIRNASDKPEIFAELVNPLFKTQLLASGANHVVCAEDLKMHVLASNVTCPGFSTLLVNLITSNDPPQDLLWLMHAQSNTLIRSLSLRRKKRAGCAVRCCHSCFHSMTQPISKAHSVRKFSAHIFGGVTPHSWRQEYELGAAMEVYGLKLPARFDGVSFSDMALDIYKRWGALVFAVKVDLQRAPNSGSNRYVRAAPHKAPTPKGSSSWHSRRNSKHKSKDKVDADAPVPVHAGITPAVAMGGRAARRVMPQMTVLQEVEEEASKVLDELGNSSDSSSSSSSVEDLPGWDTFGNLNHSDTKTPGIAPPARTALVLNPGRGMRMRTNDLVFIISIHEHTVDEIRSQSKSSELPPVMPLPFPRKQTKAQGEDTKEEAGSAAGAAGAGTGAGGGSGSGSGSGGDARAEEEANAAIEVTDSSVLMPGATPKIKHGDGGSDGYGEGQEAEQEELAENGGDGAGADPKRVSDASVEEVKDSEPPATSMQLPDVQGPHGKTKAKAPSFGNFSMESPTGSSSAWTAADSAVSSDAGSQRMLLIDSEDAGSGVGAGAGQGAGGGSPVSLVSPAGSKASGRRRHKHRRSHSHGRGLRALGKSVRRRSKEGKQLAPEGRPTLAARGRIASRYRNLVNHNALEEVFARAEVNDPLAFEQHTVVCPGASIDSVHLFVAALRAAPPSDWRDVIILSKDIEYTHWVEIGQHEKVHWYHGSALSHSDLANVGVVRAHSVVVVSKPDPPSQPSLADAPVERHMVDYSTIMSAYAIQSFAACKAYTVAELVFPSNGKFLRLSSHSAGSTDTARPLSQQPSNLALTAHVALAGATLPSTRISANALRDDSTRRSLVSWDSYKEKKPGQGMAAATPAMLGGSRLKLLGFSKSMAKLEGLGGGSVDGSTAGFEDDEADDDDAPGAKRRMGGKGSGVSTQDFYNLESFAAGSFFSPKMMQLLLFQAFYNRYLIPLMGGLLRNGMGSSDAASTSMDGTKSGDLMAQDPHRHLAFETKDDDDMLLSTPVSGSSNRSAASAQQASFEDNVWTGERHACEEGVFQQSFVRQIGIPKSFSGHTFGSVLKHLLTASGTLPIAILRAAGGPCKAQHPYVYTNPLPMTVMHADDRLYVLVSHSS